MLEARDIWFGYSKDVPILQGVTLSVSPGERVCISAPSGVGKTTLCSLLAGYNKPWQGQIMVDKKPLPYKGCMPVQMIWQHPERVLDPLMTINKSLTEAGKVSSEMLDELGIDLSWLTRYPLELSGGQLQRICIARALSVSPQYLICDEISTMLDAVTQMRIWKTLISYIDAHDIGMVLVTHSEALREHVATRVVTL